MQIQLQFNKIKNYSTSIFDKLHIVNLKEKISKFKKKEVVEDIEVTNLRKQVEDALNVVHQREHNFENAESDYIDIAIKELELARFKYILLLKEYKKLTSAK